MSSAVPNSPTVTNSDLFIGALSGTSVDGIDVALVRFAPRPLILAARTQPLTPDLQAKLRTITDQTPLGQAAELDVRIARCFADAILALLSDSEVQASQVRAIGSHGQTIWHAPAGPVPYTIQIGDPNVIAQSTGITTVADFRRRDIAAGGQGAPLVPAFHRDVFRSDAETRCILNLGGIANVTVLPRDASAPVSGFDTGPANTLLDAWVRKHLGKSYDDGGSWAASGTAHIPLLDRLLADPYFRQPTPKSTGPEHFNLRWLQSHLEQLPSISAADVQATLLELTAQSVATAIEASASDAAAVYVCGGGAHNLQLLRRLEHILAPRRVVSTDELGLDPDYVEAAAFAWLARRTLRGEAGNLPAVTGAREPVILGGIFAGAPNGAP
jgi:anhydro-N-acetylmuramic acid kinase